jgi:hypothetical protein
VLAPSERVATCCLAQSADTCHVCGLMPDMPCQLRAALTASTGSNNWCVRAFLRQDHEPDIHSTVINCPDACQGRAAMQVLWWQMGNKLALCAEPSIVRCASGHPFGCCHLSRCEAITWMHALQSRCIQFTIYALPSTPSPPRVIKVGSRGDACNGQAHTLAFRTKLNRQFGPLEQLTTNTHSGGHSPLLW